jgi:hypothetical protein
VNVALEDAHRTAARAHLHRTARDAVRAASAPDAARRRVAVVVARSDRLGDHRAASLGSIIMTEPAARTRSAKAGAGRAAKKDVRPRP